MMSFFNNRVVKNLIIICLLYFVSRTGIYCISYFGYNLFSRYDAPPNYLSEEQTGQGFSRMELPTYIFDTYLPKAADFVKFDSDYYLKIAEKGYDTYHMDEEHPAADWPFFPLYPLLIYIIHAVIPLPYAWIGFLISNLLAVLSLYFIYSMTEELTGNTRIAEKSVVYLLIFPTSLYLSIIYTESLFLFLSTLCLFLIFRKKYGLAIAAASLSTVTRIPGAANIMLVGLFLLKEAGYNPFKIKLKYYAGFILSAIPLLSYFTYLYYLTGDFFAVFHELSLNWGRTTSIPFIGYFYYFIDPYFVTPAGWDLSLVSFVFTTLIIIIYIAYVLMYKKNIELCIYGLVLLLIPLSSATYAFTSVLRYYIVSFPLFIFLSEMSDRHRVIDFTFTAFLFSFHVIYTIAFFNNYTFVV